VKLLESKIAIITGASSGIGLAASKLFASHGARLVLVARSVDRLDALCAEIRDAGGEAVSSHGDVTEAETHKAAVNRARSEYGGLDVAFNNAGLVGPVAPLAEITADQWELIIATNLTAACMATCAQVPAMLERGGGSLIFTSTFVGNSVGMPGMGAYGTAKAGLGGLVKSITADYAHRGIRANALFPGGTDTPMAGDAEQKEWAATLHPARRIAQPEEIAQAALFLASDMASFVCGSSLWADGGNAATKIQALW
jgi:NAD(P)-dependent dehydrogenase (short-subunit alcohol dehydrogenase family)